MTDTARDRARGVVEGADRVPTSREELAADRLRVLREAIEFKDRFTRFALSEAAVEEPARVIDPVAFGPDVNPDDYDDFDGYCEHVCTKARAIQSKLAEMAEGAK